MEIFAASTSVHKKLATRGGVQEVHPEREDIAIKFEGTNSEVNAQPETTKKDDETLRGASNRKAHLKKIIGGASYDILLAIENGVGAQQVGNDTVWFDYAWILAEDAVGKQYYVHSPGVEIDADVVKEARERGFATTTIGDILAERAKKNIDPDVPQPDTTDPHWDLTSHTVKRYELLKDTLKIILGRLLKNGSKKPKRKEPLKSVWEKIIPSKKITLDIQVGSTNNHKKTATEGAFNDIFPEIPHNVVVNRVDGGLDAQLESKDKIWEGALHRLTKLKEITSKTRADILLVMQDGIYSQEISGEVHWFNMAAVLAEDAEGNQSRTFSIGIEIDADVVAEARERGFKTTTIGDIIAERAKAERDQNADTDLDGQQPDPTDPQRLITNDILGRSEILRQAVKVAIGQLLMKSSSLRSILK